MYLSTEWGLNDVVNLQNENKKLIGLSVATHTDYVFIIIIIRQSSCNTRTVFNFLLYWSLFKGIPAM